MGFDAGNARNREKARMTPGMSYIVRSLYCLICGLFLVALKTDAQQNSSAASASPAPTVLEIVENYRHRWQSF